MRYLQALPVALGILCLATVRASSESVPLTAPLTVRSHDGIAELRLTARIGRPPGPSFSYFLGHDPFWIQTAPTIEVRPGDLIRVAYHNSLPPIISDDSHGLPDDTNLHFHGLTTSPNAPGDDVLTTVLQPLGRTTYDVRVTADQPPGIYWYHPHVHGESSWQVGNGMAGAIVVDGIANAVPQVAGLRERLIIVRQTFLHPSVETVSLNKRICGLSRLPASQRIAFLRAHPSLAKEDDEKLNTVITLNDQPIGAVDIGIAPGEREFFRVINATPKRNLDLAVDGESLDLVGEDGVPIGYLPGTRSSERVPDVVIPPGGRAEFIVTGQKSPATLRSIKFDSGPKGDPNPPLVLGTLTDDTGTFAAPEPTVPPAFPQAHVARDYYRTAPPAPVVQRTVRLEETSDGSKFFINHRSFGMNDAPMFVAKSGTVEEWTLVNESQEVHSFHIHQVHFLVESINGRIVPPAERHWLDTQNVPYERHHVPGRVKILVDFRNPVVRGTFVFHCHILDHEDGGMMAKIRVV